MIVAVAIFGLLGGVISAILSVAKSSTQLRIPEQMSGFFIVLMRIFVGAAAAIAVYIFFQAGILTLKITTSAMGFLAISFAAGFSERLVTRAVKSITGKEK